MDKIGLGSELRIFRVHQRGLFDERAAVEFGKVRRAVSLRVSGSQGKIVKRFETHEQLRFSRGTKIAVLIITFLEDNF
jgi:hypothetical protein